MDRERRGWGNEDEGKKEEFGVRRTTRQQDNKTTVNGPDAWRQKGEEQTRKKKVSRHGEIGAGFGLFVTACGINLENSKQDSQDGKMGGCTYLTDLLTSCVW